MNETRGASARWIVGSAKTNLGDVPQVSTALCWADRLGAWKARWGIRRMQYAIEPGLYAVQAPSADSPVLVSANYKMSFDRLRSQLAGIDAWILALDTRGINVWCAAGKGTFGTDEIVIKGDLDGQSSDLADVWQWTSLAFLIFLSGFSALPPQLIRAARILGAGRWQIFWRVQLPLLKPVIVIAVVIRSMEALKIFDQSVLLTFGGPGNSTQTVAFYLWRQVWQFNKFGFGAAASIILLVMFSALIYYGIYLLVRERATLQREGG